MLESPARTYRGTNLLTLAHIKSEFTSHRSSPPPFSAHHVALCADCRPRTTTSIDAIRYVVVNFFVCFQSVILQESRGKRPLKIWDSWRNIRKGLVVGSFEELLVRGMW